MRLTRWTAVALAATSLAFATTTAGTVAAASGSPSIQRISGDDRYLTALAVSRHGWAAVGTQGTAGQLQAGAVVVARGDAFADALAGVPLAGKMNAPILLTEPGALRDDVKSELVRVLAGDKTVYILGGESAVSPVVAGQIAALGFHVVRLGGNDRAHTALAIAGEISPEPASIFVATGEDYPDALAAGPMAVGDGNGNFAPGKNGVLLLTNGSKLDPDVAAYLRMHPTRGNRWIYAVGGPAVTALESVAPVYTGFTPLYGQDRFESASAIATHFGSVRTVGVATGFAWPDALTGGAYMASVHGPVVLPDPKFMAMPSWPYLTTNNTAQFWQLENVYVFGGAKAVDGKTYDYVKRVTNAH